MLEVKISGNVRSEPRYPCVRFHQDLNFAVLFTDVDIGMVIWAGDKCGHTVGTYSKVWLNKEFVDWTGTLVLDQS